MAAKNPDEKGPSAAVIGESGFLLRDRQHRLKREAIPIDGTAPGPCGLIGADAVTNSTGVSKCGSVSIALNCRSWV